MNDAFEKRVRAAAVAGWWVVLITVGFITLQWVIYLAVMHTRPAWCINGGSLETSRVRLLRGRIGVFYTERSFIAGGMSSWRLAKRP